MTDDHSAGLFWTTHARGRGNDAIEYAGATLLEFDDDGLIRYLRAYFELEKLARAIHRETFAAERFPP